MACSTSAVNVPGLGKIGTTLHDQAVRVDQPDAPSRLALRATLRNHGRRHEIGDPGRSLSCTEEKKGLFRELGPAHAQRREDACERNGRRPLDVIIEHTGAVAISMQQAKRAMVGKILELDQHPGKYIPCRADEFIDELVVLGSAQPTPA